VTAKTIYVKDIKTGDRVSEIFLAAEKNLAYSQKGSAYLNLRLKDRTGEMDGKIWENALAWDKAFKKGDLIRIQARAVSFKNAVQLSIIELRKVEDETVDLADYFPVAKGDRVAMFNEILTYCGQVKTPCLSALLHAFFQDEKIVELINKNFDLRPGAIIRDLRLRRPIYKATAAYGHFGRTDIDAPWEVTNKAETLRKQAGL